MDNYYKGILAFKKWKNKNNPDASFDWADLQPWQREDWAKKEQEEGLDTQGDPV